MTAPALPSAGSILGNTSGATTGQRQKRPMTPTGQQPQPGQAPQTQGSQTFAQMQQSGQARPAPPSPNMAAQAAPTAQPAQPAAPAQPSSPGSSPVQGQLNQAVSQALQSGSRYNLPQVQQVQSALTNQLQEQFNQQDAQLKTQQAARGLSASTFGGGQMGDLKTNQDNALASMNAQLIQNQAATAAQDQSAALGAGQANVNQSQNNALGVAGLTGQYGGSQTLASQLGLGQLGLSQQSLAQQGSEFGQNLGLQTQLGLGNLDLANRSQAQSTALAQGALTGNYNGEQTLGALQLGQSNTQFNQQLAQALGIAQMQNNTENYGIQTQAAANQNTLMYQVMAAMTGMTADQIQQLMKNMGGPTPVPTGTGNGTPATGGTPSTGTNNGPSGGTGTDGGTGGKTPTPTADPNRLPSTTTTLPPATIGGSRQAPTGNASLSTQVAGALGAPSGMPDGGSGGPPPGAGSDGGPVGQPPEADNPLRGLVGGSPEFNAALAKMNAATDAKNFGTAQQDAQNNQRTFQQAGGVFASPAEQQDWQTHQMALSGYNMDGSQSDIGHALDSGMNTLSPEFQKLLGRQPGTAYAGGPGALPAAVQQALYGRQVGG